MKLFSLASERIQDMRAEPVNVPYTDRGVGVVDPGVVDAGGHGRSGADRVMGGGRGIDDRDRGTARGNAAIAEAIETGQTAAKSGNTGWQVVASASEDSFHSLGKYSAQVAYGIVANPDSTYTMTWRNDIYDYHNFATGVPPGPRTADQLRSIVERGMIGDKKEAELLA